MTELIDKDKVKELPVYEFGVSLLSSEKYVKLSDLEKLPTTTEADIRASAIDEFAEKFIYTAICEGCSGCTNCYETGSQYRCDRYSYLKQVAEQLKGE